MSTPLITLTSDFGDRGPYVAQMKGVILSQAPAARIVDISHSIPPQAVEEGAWLLSEAAFRFPPGTIHVAVVDPGVGSDRALVLARMAGRTFLAPDNGLLSLCAQAHPPDLVVRLTQPQYWIEPVSRTFHGRDILSPVAAQLCLGVAPEEFGEVVQSLTDPRWPGAEREGQVWTGRIVAVDSFGNLITNIPEQAIAEIAVAPLVIACGDQQVHGMTGAYSERATGELIALIGSHRRLELAVVDGSAAQRLQVSPGAPVRLFPGTRPVPEA